MTNVRLRHGRLIVAVCCICAVLFLAGTVVAQNTGTEELTGLEKLLKDAMDELLAKYAEIDADPSLSKEQKKQLIMEWAAPQRFGENQDIYYQFFKVDGTCFLDDVSQDDVGKNFEEYRDNDELYVFQEMRKIASGDPGFGFLDYMWPRPNGAFQVSKKSFVIMHLEFGILCVGKYLETIEPRDLEPREMPDPSRV